MSLKVPIIRIHRWLSLSACLIWGLQALSGSLLLFDRDILDARIPGAHQATNPHKIEAALDRTTALGASIRTITTTAGAPDRYIVQFDDRSGDSRETVIDGEGTLLASRNGDVLNTIFDAVDTLHTELFMGSAGTLVLGVSGVLLLTNIALGLASALGKGFVLKRAMRPPFGGVSRTRLFQWHRAAGLWGMIPAVVIVTTGGVMALSPQVEGLLSARSAPAPISAMAHARATITLSSAIRTAQQRYPGASLADVRFPTRATGVYRVRLRQASEWLRAFGRTTVYVDANTGAILVDIDPARQPAGRRFLDNLYPIHTGEVAGTGGRIAVLAVGLWLLTMLSLGLALWNTRRRRPT